MMAGRWQRQKREVLLPDSISLFLTAREMEWNTPNSSHIIIDASFLEQTEMTEKECLDLHKKSQEAEWERENERHYS